MGSAWNPAADADDGVGQLRQRLAEVHQLAQRVVGGGGRGLWIQTKFRGRFGGKFPTLAFGEECPRQLQSRQKSGTIIFSQAMPAAITKDKET